MLELTMNTARRAEARRPARASHWIPAVDLSETQEAFHIEMDLPGMPEDGIDVTVDQGVLTVRGRRTRVNADSDTGRALLRERPAGEFLRQFSLPDSADVTEVDARLVQGVLRVRIGKRQAALTRRIPVEH